MLYPVQNPSRNKVGGINHKGVFTRSRAPKMVAYVLREFWANGKAKLAALEAEPQLEASQPT